MLAIFIVAAIAMNSPEGLARRAQQAQTPDIRNFLQVTPEFCTAGQPRIEHFAALKSKGVKAVLNLRQPSEHRADEEKSAVEAAGMKYFNIPGDLREANRCTGRRVPRHH